MRKEHARHIVEEAAATYDVIAHHFSETRFAAGPWIRSLTDELRSGDAVLDIGCGNGRLLEGISNDINYTGVDVSKQLLNICKEKFPERANSFLHFNGSSLPFADHAFTHIFMLATFHHVPKALQLPLLQECRRVLVPGGALVLSVWHLWRMPFIRYWLLSSPKKFFSRDERRTLYIPWRTPDGTVLAKRFFYMFTRRELAALVRAAGFTIISNELVIFRKQKNYVIRART